MNEIRALVSVATTAQVACRPRGRKASAGSRGIDSVESHGLRRSSRFFRSIFLFFILYTSFRIGFDAIDKTRT